ncbi:hypothetical protein B0H13DRAFT_2276905 [Mycena leptocephala]|nr:hypothetical protein B0H13DRAFT_2276905 [Mycena leptocephala]
MSQYECASYILCYNTEARRRLSDSAAALKWPKVVVSAEDMDYAFPTVDFYALEDGRPCQKCALLMATTSDVEKAITRSKAQCKSCSLVYGQLQSPLCHKCCQTYAAGDSPIAGPIVQLTGAVDQILALQTSTPRAQSPSLLKAVAAKASMSGIGTGSTSKSREYIQELKDKREQGNKVKFNISMAKSVSKKNGASAFVQLPEIRFIEHFNDEDDINLALDTIVVETQEFHAESHPTAGKIYRSIVTFYAVISTANVVRINSTATTTGTVLEFLKHFKMQNYISEAQFNTKTLFLRLIVLDGASAMPSGIPASGRPSSSVRPSKRVASAASGDQKQRRPSKPEVRKSAYVPRRVVSQAPPPGPRFSRNPLMFTCMFKRYAGTIKGGRTVYSIPHDAEWEPIQIAIDWRDGLKKSKRGEAFHETGYIGAGSTKRVIYARIGNVEYALCQSSDEKYPIVLELSQSGIMAEAVIHSKSEQVIPSQNKNYNKLKNTMTCLSKNCGTWNSVKACAKSLKPSLLNEMSPFLASFRFHVDGAILGTLQPLSDSDVDPDARLPHLKFLATRLLPCGPAHKPIQKFTGNDDCGPAPTDDLTMALHAFSHFTAVYTNNDAILCDLQGMYNGKVMVLIDPQMHTAERERDKHMYWDNGPEAIRHFMEHHLRNLQYEVLDPDSQGDRPVTPPQNRNVRSRSISTSPIQRKRPTGPVRIGTSDLFTVENFLRLNDRTRVSIPVSVTDNIENSCVTIYWWHREAAVARQGSGDTGAARDSSPGEI